MYLGSEDHANKFLIESIQCVQQHFRVTGGFL